jgi:Cdc6-like AAA superfamily ATPase
MKGFFAYTAKPPQIAETIRLAVEDVRRFHAVTEITEWSELEVAGHFISSEVLRSIDQSDFLIADITSLNFNVTYEVGYAIGRGKRLVIVRNEAYAKSEDEKIRKLGIYDTLGYKNYQNSRDLATLIKSVRDVETLLRDIPLDRNQPLYVTKTRFLSDYAIRISARLKKSGLGYRSFDPTEQPRLSALDAISQVTRSIGVLVHFVPTAVEDSEIHNLRCAFIAGLADGLNKSVAFLQEGYDPVPIDYRDFVEVITHPTQIDEAVANLAGEVVTKFSSAVEEPSAIDSSWLERVHFGASSAENEIADLADYYLATDEFRRALQGEARLVVGRKGSGKSAVFFRVRDKVSSSRRNVVLDLKPDGYQLVKLKDRVLKAMDKGSQEHTITAFWHCVLILEIARAALYADKTTHRLDDSIYNTYLQLDEKYKEYGYDSGQGDFAERISSLIYRIEARFKPGPGGEVVELSSPQVTELIYDNDVTKLSDAIIAHLKKKGALWILFDNIDKGWTPTGIDESDILTLRALLEASRKLQRNLVAEGVEARSLVFLRNDVYELLLDRTADRGKEQKVIVDWRDPDALKQLVALRISASLGVEHGELDELWARIAVSHVHGENSYQYIVDRCLMRPRYLLDLLKHARGGALTLRHEKITEDDIDKAVAFFSTDVVQDTNLELRDVFPAHDGLLYAFIGAKSTLSLDDAKLILMLYKIDDSLIPSIVNLLLWYGFLGVQDDDHEAQYIYNRGYNNKLFEAYVNSRIEHGAALVINPAFWDGLDIEKV